jgi:predicted anti-sigma-YlaC factor YlaD
MRRCWNEASSKNGVEAAACARARRRVSLSLDGQLADPVLALLADHLEDCAACSSFQARSAASTAMLRGPA